MNSLSLDFFIPNIDMGSYEDLEALRSIQEPKSAKVGTFGVMQFSNITDSWVKVYVNDKHVQLLKPGHKGQKFMYPVKTGDVVSVFGPGRDYGIDAKVYFRKRGDR